MTNDQLYGLITGILFGFLLQKGRVLRYDKQIGALRMLDMTIVKFMMSAIVVGMVGTYLLVDLGLAKLSIKPMITGAIVIGGLLFGVGWGLFGYCPGTSMGAVGEGRIDGIWGIAGMVAGASLYAAAFPLLKGTVLKWGDYGKITLQQVFGVNHWFVIIPFVILTLLLFRWLEKKGL